MFHRVKSEVQDAEQKKQEVDNEYRQEESRPMAGSQEEEKAPEPVEEKATRPAYGQTTPKEEESTMTAAQDDAPVQGKYARQEEDRTEPTAPARGGYQPAMSRPGAYNPSGAAPYGAGAPGAPGASAPTGYSAPQAPETSFSSASDRTLTIGRGINMSGEIEACDHLLVEGTVEAALKGAKVLDIAESGTFYGTVEIEEAAIAGRFEGDITVNGRLTIKSSGVITGSIAYRELEVEAGAMLDGRMTPLKTAVDQKNAEKYRAGTEASAMAKAKEIVSKKDDREPANAERGLFSKAHASY